MPRAGYELRAVALLAAVTYAPIGCGRVGFSTVDVEDGGRDATSCDASRGDCDGVVTNGCEEDLSTSQAHCGVCGNACVMPQLCTAGSCCRAGCPCAQICRAVEPCLCEAGCQCNLDSRATNAAATCRGVATQCRVDGVGSADLGVTQCESGARCIIDATGSSNAIELSCTGVGTTCEIDCTSVSNCFVRCTAGANCVVRCTGASNCPGPSDAWVACEGIGMSCPSGVEQCNVPACP